MELVGNKEEEWEGDPRGDIMGDVMGEGGVDVET